MALVGGVPFVAMIDQHWDGARATEAPCLHESNM